MNYLSHADLGGQPESRPIVQEADGDYFHARWEERVLALTLAMGATGLWNIDMSRAARETLPDYAQLSYYQIWFRGLERLVAERGLLQKPATASSPALRASHVAAVLGRGSPTRRTANAEARFKVGDVVCTETGTPGHHTRLPGYARGRRGTIERVHGAYVFSDSNAHGGGEAPQWLYGVRFEARELWGDAAAEPDSRVTVDAFESYLTRG